MGQRVRRLLLSKKVSSRNRGARKDGGRADGSENFARARAAAASRKKLAGQFLSLGVFALAAVRAKYIYAACRRRRRFPPECNSPPSPLSLSPSILSMTCFPLAAVARVRNKERKRACGAEIPGGRAHLDRFPNHDTTFSLHTIARQH